MSWLKQDSLSTNFKLERWDASCYRINTVCVLLTAPFLKGAESPVTHQSHDTLHFLPSDCSSCDFGVRFKTVCMLNGVAYLGIPLCFRSAVASDFHILKSGSILWADQGIRRMNHLLVASRLLAASFQVCIIYKSLEFLYTVPAAARRWTVDLFTLCSCILHLL